jgi:hypothetical protein
MRSNEPVSAESFTKLKLLGKGDVGKVYLVEEKVIVMTSRSVDLTRLSVNRKYLRDEGSEQERDD